MVRQRWRAVICRPAIFIIMQIILFILALLVIPTVAFAGYWPSPTGLCGGVPALKVGITTSAVPTGTASLSVSFTAKASGGSGSYSYYWVFGDGSTASGSATETHSFTSVGTYTTTVVVNDTCTNTAQFSKTVMATGASYYVSTTGSDSNDGTTPTTGGGHGPFLTLTHAQTAARSGNKTIQVESGTYTLAASLAFTSSDNGEVWIPYNGATVDIDGVTNTYSITVTGISTNFTFNGFTLTNLGATGGYGAFQISGGTNVTFRWNTVITPINWAVQGAVTANSLVDSNTMISNGPANNGSVNNYTMVYYGGSSNNIISHNLIYDSVSGGILLQSSTASVVNNNNLIDSNIIMNVANSTGFTDGGAIYLQDLSPCLSTGNKITNNYIFGIGLPLNTTTRGIYLDDDTCNVTITGNTVAAAGYTAFQLHGGSNDVFRNNVFDLSQGALLGDYQGENGGGQSDTGMTGNIFQSNIIFTDGTYFLPTSLWVVANLYGDDALPTDLNNDYFNDNGIAMPNTTVVDTNPFTIAPLFNRVAPGFPAYVIPSNSTIFGSISWQPLTSNRGPLDSPFSVN